MKEQHSLFDEGLGDKLKQQGMELAEDNARSSLEIARDIAVEISKSTNGLCDADQVGRVLKRDHDIDTLGPAAGSLFRGKHWRFTGNWVKSQRIVSHSRMIRQWLYVS